MNANHAYLGGNVARDLELRYLPNGTACLDFSIANTRRWKTQSGEAKEDVAFVDCVAFGRTAENFAKYHKKGDRCFVQGHLTQNRWETKTGEKRQQLKISVQGFEFCNSGKQDQASAQPAQATRSAAQAAPAGAQATGTMEQDEVPF